MMPRIGGSIHAGSIVGAVRHRKMPQP